MHLTGAHPPYVLALLFQIAPASSKTPGSDIMEAELLQFSQMINVKIAFLDEPF